MRGLSLSLALMLGGVASAQSPAPLASAPVASVAQAPIIITDAPVMQGAGSAVFDQADGARNFLQSDHAFEDFIGPMTAPILSKDPRSLTEIRPLFVSNWIPKGNAALRGGDFQVYAAQVRVAITDRLTFIADKDGLATINLPGAQSQTGFLDLAAGFKYTLYRDVENQALGTIGFMYEAPTGEANVFQNHGPGVVTIFGVYGQEFGDKWHLVLNQAFQFGLDSNQNSSFFFTQVHIDKQLFGWLYPLAELNWYQYVNGGDRGLPAVLGEGDGLINLGTSGMSGRDLLTAAVGMKARLSRHFETGVAWETPLSSRKDLMLQRLQVEMIFRY